MDDKDILVVEDDTGVREALVEALELEGHHVVASKNGKEALERLEQMPRPSVILLDLMMPVMNGWEFLERLHEEEREVDCPVVIVSAFEQTARTINAAAFVPKPIDLNVLLDTMNSLW
jgi:CheY-like chemotaxis protein